MDFLDEVEDMSEDGEETTAEQLVKDLHAAWVNEKKSPTLLDAKPEVVECVLDQIKEMQNNIEQQNDASLKISIHQLEVERIRFVLTSYIRCRLTKLENNFGYYLRQHEAGITTKLSPKELEFVRNLSAMTSEHLEQSALKHMPAMIRNIDLLSRVPPPNLEKYVFAAVKESVDGLIVDPETDDKVADVIDMTAGEQYLIRYKLIERLVDEEKVVLV